VVANGSYTIDQIRADESSPPQSGCFEIRCGSTKFVLAAIWPVQLDGGPSYDKILRDMFERFRDRLGQHPVVAAGDFNSNTRVKAQRASHPKFVNALQKANLVSAYHHHADVAHGDEVVHTYVQGKVRPRSFHIDYCFVSKSLRDAATVTIPQAEAWNKHSDHFPLVLDIPDSAIRSAAR
jgi:exodeoxyribonuclease-3